MPPWDQLNPEFEVLELLHDIEAAECVRDVLPESSADRAMMQRTIDRLTARVRSLLPVPPRGGHHP